MELNEALLKIKKHSINKEFEKQTEEEKKYNEFIFLKNKILSFCDECGEQLLKDEAIVYDGMQFCSEECLENYKKNN